MSCRIPSGSSFGRCCPSRCGAANGSWMTARYSTGSCGSSARGRPGGTCPSGTVRGPRRHPLPLLGPGRHLRAAAQGRPGEGGRGRGHRLACRQHPKRGAPKPRTRTLPGRSDQQETPRLRRSGARWLSPSPAGTPTTAPSSPPLWGRYGCPGTARDGPASGSSTYGAEGLQLQPSGPGPGGGASTTPFPTGPTRSATGFGGAASAGARRPSTNSSTSGATWSNAASAAGSNGAASPPDTTTPPSPISRCHPRVAPEWA
ncbi:hypothetical protein SUDANB37_00026 [Streptomyces sp. enrichment culture]